MRFLWTLLICLWSATPSVRAGEPCECDPGGRGDVPEEPTPDPQRYSVTWIDQAPAGGFYSFAPLGDGRLVGAGQRLWRYDGLRWHRQRALRGERGDGMLLLGAGRLAVMHEPSPVGSTDTSRQGALEIFAPGSVSRAYPPAGCTLSNASVVHGQLLGAGQCADESPTRAVVIRGVVLRLEGEEWIELGPRPLRPIRAVGFASGFVVALNDVGVLLRLDSGVWRRGLANLPTRGWRSLTQSAQALWLGSDRGELVRVGGGELRHLPTIQGGGAIIELAATNDAALARVRGDSHERLWLWDGQEWRDRGATPDDCSAVDYCVGHVTHIVAGGAELWALRDGVPEGHLPQQGTVPFFPGRDIDDMAVGTRGELFWTRHDARHFELLRSDATRTEVVASFEPVELWAGADGLPRFVDAGGDLFRYVSSTGEFERRTSAPCDHARLLLGYGDHAYFSCPGETGAMRLWTGERYLRLSCPAGVCGARIVGVRVVGEGFPLSMSPPRNAQLLVHLADGVAALRRAGEWRRLDSLEASLAEADAETTLPSRRRVDSSGRVWALSDGRLLFDGPDSFSGGRGIATEEPLPTPSRFAMTRDARVIWIADGAGRLFRLSLSE